MRGKTISICTISILGIAMLFFPAQQGYAIFTLAPELNDEQLIDLYKLKEIVFSEQTRDKLFVLDNKQNPYLDTVPNVIAYFENNEEESLNSVDRRNENFQLMKDEQISIAEKKCKEILGGKIISNPFFDEPVNKKSIHKFKIDNQTGFMNKYSDDFENYRLLQISIAEDVRENNWKENHWRSNPYQNNESIRMLSNNEESKIFNTDLDYRQSEEFKNLIIEQISLAENIRNEMLKSGISGNLNPYLDENIDENIDELLDKTNTNIIITGWSDPTYVTDKLDFNIIDRDAKGFEVIKGIELEIAQNTLNGMAFLSNSEEIDKEILSSTDENKKLNNVERDDKGFEFFKNKQIDAAEKKLMEILGQKNIHNSDYRHLD